LCHAPGVEGVVDEQAAFEQHLVIGLDVQPAQTDRALDGLLELGRPEDAHAYLTGEIERYRRLWRADELIGRHWRPRALPLS
jgi:hypothetical protein